MVGQLRTHQGRWLWTLIPLAVASSAVTGLLLGMTTALAAAHGKPEIIRELNAVGASVVAYCMAAAVAVVGATTGLTLTTLGREHALWMILGVPRRLIRGVLLGQVVLVGALGWLIALPASLLVARITLDQWASLGLAPVSLPVRCAGWEPLASLGLIVLAAVLGGWGSARRAARMPEIAALKEADAPRVHMGWGRVIAALCVLSMAGAMAVIVRFDAQGPEDRAAAMLMGNLLLVATLLILGGWTLRPLLWAWTALVPCVDPAWFIAREVCRTRSARSISTVLPFAMALSLLGVLLCGGNATRDGDVQFREVMVLLGWALLVSWVGGAGVIALAGHERERDVAQVVVEGGTRHVVVRIAMYEGVVYALTAALFGVATTALSLVTVAAAAAVPLGYAVAGAPWGLLAGAGVLTALTTCAAVAPSVVRAFSIPVVETLRR